MSRSINNAALALLLTATATTAQSVDSIFTMYSPQTPGCAVAVTDAGRTVFSRGYGMASLEHDLPITPASAFYAASVSKQFTAFAVALLADQGKLSLDDDIRKWMPEVPDFNKTITVRHLIHHTSGLRDYFGLLGMTGWSFDGPVTERQFLELVSRQKALNFDPGTRHLYSNTGYVLLSILVKRVSGKSLREFSDEALFKPLGMSNTSFRDDHAMLIRNRAFAYVSPRPGVWQLAMPGFDVVGDGGLYTTVEDLAKWARNFDQPVVGKNIITTILTRGRLGSGDSIAYAFGLSHNTIRGVPVVEHGGAYAGYRAHLLRFPNQQLAVAVLCNAGNANASGFAQRVSNVFMGDRFPARVAAPASNNLVMTPVAVGADRLNTLAGVYWDATSESLRRFDVRENALVANNAVRLSALNDSEFNGTNGVIYKFAGDKVEETIPTGDKLSFTRMQPALTDSAALSRLAGEYYSPELDITWRIERPAAGLTVKLPGMLPVPLQPVFRDAFTGPGGVLRFERSGDGQVTGFVVGAGRVRGFRFTRR